MKRTKEEALLALMMLVWFGLTAGRAAEAQSGAVDLSVETRIVNVVILPVPVPVHFGALMVNQSPGTATMDPQTGELTLEGGVISAEGLHQLGRVSFIAPTAGTLAIFSQSPSVGLTGNFSSSRTLRFSPEFSPSTTMVSPGDEVEVFVGGTLEVPAHTPDDSYSGVFVMMVNFG